MFTIIAALIVLAIIVRILMDGKDAWGEYNWGDRILWCLLSSFFVGAIAFMVGMLLSLWFGSIEDKRSDVIIPLYSLKNEYGLRGDFYMGSGSINGANYYYAYTDNGRGGMRQTQFRASECDIFSTTNKPYAYWQIVTFKINPWIHIWPKITHDQITRYDLYVPTNTVIKEFKLN